MRGKLVVLTLILCAFLLGGAGMYFLTNKESNTIITAPSTNTSGVIKCKNNVKIDESGISQAVGKIYDATVTIQSYRNSRLYATGSGFIYKKDDKYGYILTNHHVIENNEYIIITLSNDDQVQGEVLGSDIYLDLAVIRIDQEHVSQVAKIGTSEDSYVGDTIITVGSPVGYEYRGTVTKGTLSGKNRMVEVSVVTTNDFMMNVLQIDAAINPGNSGGPLLNVNGEVIGINSLKLVEDEVEGMGFAIPIEYAMKYIDKLENDEVIERPYIGISMLNVTDTYRLYQSGIKLNKDIEYARDLVIKYPDGKDIGGLLSLKSGSEYVTLTSGTLTEFKSFMPKYIMYNEHILDAYRFGMKYVNFFGISGNFDPKNPIYGVYEFKRGFNGQVIEMVGEFTYKVSNTYYIYNMFRHMKILLRNITKR